MNVIKQAVAVDLKQRSVGMDHSEDSFFVIIQRKKIKKVLDRVFEPKCRSGHATIFALQDIFS